MLLYLVQHGEAAAKSEDPERPLTVSGRQDVAAVAAVLRRLALPVDRVLHSGKTRARQTADLLGPAVGCDAVERADALDPMDDPAPWLARVDAERTTLMLVGHLPHLARLAGALLVADVSREVVAFRQGGVVVLERNPEGAWMLRWNLTPDLAKVLRLA